MLRLSASGKRLSYLSVIRPPTTTQTDYFYDLAIVPTSGGKVKPTTRTAAFIALVKGRPVYPALSGKTMEFDGSGTCVAGC